jgi:type IV pilus assembly protein PilW
MISITISAVILSGVVQLYATSSRTQKVQEGASRIQENARYIFSRLEKDIAQSGYVGCFNFDPDRITNNLAGESGNGQLYDFGEPLEGGNENGYRKSDILTFRYAAVGSRIPLVERSGPMDDLVLDASHANYAALQQYQIAMVTDCSRAAVFMITNDPDTDGVIQHVTGVTSPPGSLNSGQSNSQVDLENTYGYSQGNEVSGGSVAYLYAGTTGGHRYSLEGSQRGIFTGLGGCSDATPQYCALYRNGDEIADGVQDMEFEVGWTDSNGNVRFGDPLTSVDWSAVDRIKVTLELNSIEDVPTAQGSQLHTKTFSRTIMIRNQLL